MGFHMLDLVPIILIALVVIGPKALQSLSRNMGKGLGQAKDMREQVLSELPIKEFTKVTRQIPMSPQQAIQMLLTPSEKEKEAEVKEK